MPKPVVQEGEDPDPTPYLFVSLEQKRIDQSKPYDGKKACWVPDDKEGFLQGEIKATKGELVTVNLPGGEVIMQWWEVIDNMILLIRMECWKLMIIYCQIVNKNRVKNEIF